MHNYIDQLWAKSNPYKSLLNHLIDTGSCAKVLMTMGCAQSAAKHMAHLTHSSVEQIIQFITYIASLHDIGKAHPEFQKKGVDLPQVEILNTMGVLNSIGSTSFRHEIYTKKVMKRIWKNTDFEQNDILEALLSILALHHQGKRGETVDIFPSNLEFWTSRQNELESILREVFLPDENFIKGCDHIDAFSMEAMSIIILADWLASGEHFEQLQYTDLRQYAELSERIAHQVVKSCGLENVNEKPSFVDFHHMWPEIPTDSMRPLQVKIDQLDFEKSALCLIEAPMGEGKTEAALFAATKIMKLSNKNGLYIALPTSATSNQMYDRVETLFRKHNIPKSRLLHSAAWLRDDQSEQYEVQSEDQQNFAEWLAPLRRGLLSQNAVGTIDQVMSSVLLLKYSVLRLLGLTNKVLILDEIHAYDAYMSTIIERLLEWCRALDIPVIMMSATLPETKKESFFRVYDANLTEKAEVAYPLVTTISQNGSLELHPIEKSYMNLTYYYHLVTSLGDSEAISDLAIAKILYGGCVCVLLNTVKSAQDVYKKVKSKIQSDTQVYLFHARFPAGKRVIIEENCVELFGKNIEKRPKKAILVCTQVVEQSLDVDFDAMITEIAPIDLLLQRSGRVHRHTRERPKLLEEANVYVLTPKNSDFGSTELIYHKLLLLRTQKYLKFHDSVAIPNEVRHAINEVYTNTIKPEEFGLFTEFSTMEEMNHWQAEGYALSTPNKEYFFAAERPEQSLFLYEDAENMVHQGAKTRIGPESARIAIVDQKTLNLVSQKYVSKMTAKALLAKTVSFNISTLGVKPVDIVEGSGLLKGCFFLPQDRPDSYLWGKNRLTIDAELGLISKE